MEDNNTPEIRWLDVREALEANDLGRIAEMKRVVRQFIEKRAMKIYLKRLSIQSVCATTLGQIAIMLKENAKDLVASFKKQITDEFASSHGLTIYADARLIQAGDTVVTSSVYKEGGKTKTTTETFRVIERQGNNWLVSIAAFENEQKKFELFKTSKTITKKNFIVGVRQAVPPIMKKPQTFYFINFTD